MPFYTAYYESPIGKIKIEATETSLVAVSFITEEKMSDDFPETENPTILKDTLIQLQEYFDGVRKVFTLQFTYQTGTEFQQTVWNELTRIPYGETISYTQLAKRLGSPKLIRAAGSANGKNPLGLIVPCHRVIGNGGELVGYAGGLWRKQWLLEHEGNKMLFPLSLR